MNPWKLGIATVLAVAPLGCPTNHHIDDTVDVPITPETSTDARDDATDAPDVAPMDAADVVRDVVAEDVPEDVPMGPPWCDTGSTPPGAVLPAGFCMREFTRLTAPRVMTFAPNGDLFVAAPATATPGGSGGGPGAIVVLADDNHDGVAEPHMFLEGQPDVHGLAFASGFLYFTNGSTVFRLPYASGQRRAMGIPQSVTNFDSGSRWTHGLAATPSGVLYGTESTNGVNVCDGRPLSGAVSIVDVAGRLLRPQARGFRNPMYMRCHFRDDTCLAAELGEDQTTGAREKILVVRANTSYGYPCCFTRGMPSGVSDPRFNCATVEQEALSIPIGDTPFGLDWERGRWPAPYRNGLFIALHGSYYLSPGPGVGSRIVFVDTDPMTHVPTGAFRTFVDGFGPTSAQMRRAADVAFSPDGRLFVSDDTGNRIYWIASTTQRRP